jgi:hypothetical protein
MSAAEASEASARTPGGRPLARTVPVLLLLLGIMFMHGTCVTGGIASSARAESPAIAVSAADELTTAGHSQDHHHHSDHASCCGAAVEAGCVALLAAAFLLFSGLSRWGASTWLGVSRHLRWAVPRLRASPHGGLARSALCVMRV